MKKLMVMVAALAMVSTSAYAADWNFYGSARVATFYDSTDSIDVPGSESDDQYNQGLQGNARIGATVKVSDELTGGFEYGAGVNVRKLYGEWNFGGGSFLVGQTYTPLNWFYSNQVYGGDNDLLAQGGLYSGREAMLQLKFGGFKVALVPANTTTAIASTSTESKFPGVELAYSMKMDNFGVKLGAGYQKFDTTFGTVDDSVTSYIFALGGNADFGAFYLGGNIYIGQNTGNMIAVDTTGDNGWDDGYAGFLTSGSVVDNDAMGLMLAGGFTFNDMFTMEAGYGYVVTSYDMTGTGGDDDKCQSYYLNATVTMAPGVFFVPEIGVIDGYESGDSKIDYFGIKWQINF